MCTYNGASRHLAEQLDSIFSQTLLPAELIVQDDGSTDNTMDLLHSYAAKAPEGMEMRIFRNEKQMGINANFFSAMCRAKGDLIAVSDQDDIWMPTKLEEQVAAMADPHMMMCVCRSVPFGERSRGALRSAPSQLQSHPPLLCFDDGALPDAASHTARLYSLRNRTSRHLSPHVLRRDDSHGSGCP